MKKIFKFIGILLGVIILAVLAGITYVKTAMPNTGDPETLTIALTP